MENKLLNKLKKSELICYSASIFVSVVGIVFVILGIVGSNISQNSQLAKIQLGFNWRWIGLILIGAAVIFALIILLVNAHKSDRIIEKETRRKQRLTAMMSDASKEENTVYVDNGKLVNPTHTIIDKEDDPSLKPTGAKEM